MIELLLDGSAAALLSCGALLILALQALLDAPELDGMSRRTVFVSPGAPAGGDGDRLNPYAGIQEMIDSVQADWVCVNLLPGVYEEDVDIHGRVFWFVPAMQYGVTIEGTVTVRHPWVKLRGVDIRSDADGIVLADGAGHCDVQQCRILRVGDGCCGINIRGEDIGECLISDNIIDLRDAQISGVTGIRLVQTGGGTRLDHNQIAGCRTGIEVCGDNSPTEPTVLSSNTCTACETGLLLAAPGIVAQHSTINSSVTGVSVSADGVIVDAGRLNGNRTAVASSGEVTVSNTVISGCVDRAVRVEGGSAALLHNTVHAHDAAGVTVVGVSGGAELSAHANIFATPDPALPHNESIAASDNLFTHRRNEAFYGDAAVFGDPGFVAAERGDFHITPDSPAANAVCKIRISRDADGAGRPWAESACIGAYETGCGRETQTIHVSADAADGDGSKERPFGDIGRAASLARPGDEIVLQPGIYEPGTVTITAAGAPDAPIVIRAATPYEAVFRGSQLRIDESAYLRIEGLRLEEGPHETIRFGPYSHDCEVVDNQIVREQEGGGHAIAVVGPGASHNLFEDNYIRQNDGGCGIHLWCQMYNQHIVVRGNDVAGCYYGCQTGVGSYPTAPPGYHLIEDNNFHHNTKDGYHSKTTDDILRNNHLHHNGTGGATTRYGSRNVMAGNCIHDNRAYGIRLHSKSHFILNNVIYGNGAAGIYATNHNTLETARFPYNFEPNYESPQEIWIAHNTIANNAGPPVLADRGSQLMLLRNILAGTGPDDPAIEFRGGGLARQVEANLYWKVRMPLLREYEGGSFGTYADPDFIDPEKGDYRPRSGSPAYDVPDLQDALGAVLSNTPAGVDLPEHRGSSVEPAG
ncbi:MAG: right-handed parallel beta-helix repeat-containing protein [Armatimonadota bacterium]